MGPILSLWTWFEANRKTVVVVAGITSAVVFVAAFIFWQQRQAVIKASEELTDALVSNAFTRTGQGVSADQLLKFASEHTGSAAGSRALFQAATTLFTDGKYSDAQVQFQRFVTEHPDHAFVPQAMLGIASALEAQGKAEEAAKSYKGVADRFKGTGLGLNASSALGRILLSQGKLAEALPLFEEVARSDASGMLGGEARIRVAEIQMKLPPPAVSQSSTNKP